MRIPIYVGEKTQNHQCGIIENVICPKCGNITHFVKIRNKITWTVMFFIPAGSVTNAAFVQCTSCGAAYEVNKKEFNEIHNNLEMLNAIQACHNDKLKKKQKLKEKYSVGFSKKNQMVAVILSIFLTFYGIPFFYIGKPLYGITCLIISLIDMMVYAGGTFADDAFLFFIAPLYVLEIGGFILAYFISKGKVKDGKGKYIASKKQQSLFTGNNE